MSLAETIFQRSPHDKQNPYVMISRAMLHDPDISPKAKGLLCYLLSLPDNWKIYHSQLQKGLNVGEEYIDSAIKELIAAGYVKRERQKLEGKFQPYAYEVSESKLFLPNGENRTGFSGPENPPVLKKDLNNRISKEILKETTTTTLRDGGGTKGWGEFYSCLEEVEISKQEKVDLSKSFDQKTVEQAIAWALHPSTRVKSTLIAALRWACSNKPPVPESPLDKFEINKAYANTVKLQVPKMSYVERLASGIEIGFINGSVIPTVVSYGEHGFQEQLQNAFRKHAVKIEK